MRANIFLDLSSIAMNAAFHSMCFVVMLCNHELVICLTSIGHSQLLFAFVNWIIGSLTDDFAVIKDLHILSVKMRI